MIYELKDILHHQLHIQEQNVLVLRLDVEL